MATARTHGRPDSTQTPTVLAVAMSPGHGFSKQPRHEIRLVAGLGVAGDGHAGSTVQHRSRVARTPEAPNLRQVHLLAGELLDEVKRRGHLVAPGDLGENVTTRGLDLLALPTGSYLHIGGEAEVEITGLRNPCAQIDRFSPGLLKEVVGRDAEDGLVRKAGVMAVVRRSGAVRPGDRIAVVMPPAPHVPLRPV